MILYYINDFIFRFVKILRRNRRKWNCLIRGLLEATQAILRMQTLGKRMKVKRQSNETLFTYNNLKLANLPCLVWLILVTTNYIRDFILQIYIYSSCQVH